MHLNALFKAGNKRHHLSPKLMLVMQLTSIILLAACLQVSASAFGQKVTIVDNNVSLKQVFKEIRKQTGYNFIYSNKTIRQATSVTLDVKNADVEDALDQAFIGQPLTYTIDDKIIIVKPKPVLPQMTEAILDKEITGQVIDSATGKPLVGVTIKVKGGSTGTVTDANGHFSLEVPDETVIIVSYLGYTRKTIPVNGRTTINISLSAAATGLNQLVVVGYGTQKKTDLTGSVAVVKGELMKDLPTTDVATALQGRAAGVEVVNSSGQPGVASTIIIRGLSSLHQAPPLYIVDGVRSSANNINIQDIASISILKDASAAAIYGASAAGGVVIITTKKGKVGKPKIRFSMRFGITKPKLIHLLNKSDYIKLQNIVHQKYFMGATQTDTLPNTDWTDALFRDGNEQNYNLSISGATPRVNYYFSGFYNMQNGTFIKNYSDIKGARINTDYKLGKTIKIGEQLILSQQKTRPTIGRDAGLHNPPFRSLPIIPIKEKDGSWGVVPPNYNGLSYQGANRVGAVESADAIDYNDRLQANVFAEVKLPFHLSFKTTFGYTYNIGTQDYYQDKYDFGPVVNLNNSLTKSFNKATQLLSNYILTFDKVLGKSHINAIAGYEQIISKTNNVNVTQSYMGLDSYSFVQTSNSTYTVSGINDPNGLIKSAFCRLNYNYDNRYYSSISIRQDANFTTFGPNKQRGIFGAASAGWNISNEKFFRSLLPIITNLKLRGSFGSVGNSNIAPYSYLSSYQLFRGYTNTALAGANFIPGGPILVGNTINAIPNPNIHWETVNETNIGLDAAALGNKLYFTIEWYNKVTNDMLYALPVGVSSGFTNSYLTNIGKVSNKGVDILLGYRDHTGGFGYDVSITGGFNRNKVLDLDGIATDALYAGTNGDAGYSISNEPVTITKTGLPFGSFYGYKIIGKFKSDEDAAKSPQTHAHAGDLIFEDYNKDGKITTEDREVIGNPNPRLVYGINVQMNWKGFDIAMLFNGVAGVELFNGIKAYEMYPFGDGNTTKKVFNDSYLGSNRLTSQPRLGVKNKDGSFTLDPNGNYTTINSYFVEKGNYLKLKNLQIGYSFTSKILEKIKVENARLFIMANNLFTITKYTGIDPELGGSVITRGLDQASHYPHTRIYSVGLDVNF